MAPGVEWQLDSGDGHSRIPQEGVVEVRLWPCVAGGGSFPHRPKGNWLPGVYGACQPQASGFLSKLVGRSGRERDDAAMTTGQSRLNWAAAQKEHISLSDLEALNAAQTAYLEWRLETPTS